jgi:hypothetical protein
MPMSSSFFYPARRHDRALSAAGQIERLARAAVRHLRAGRLSLGSTARSRPAGWPGCPASALTETLPGAPVLYLPAVSWSYRFQRPQHLALALARAGHPVLYVDGFLRSRLLPARHLLHSRGVQTPTASRWTGKRRSVWRRRSSPACATSAP